MKTLRNNMTTEFKITLAAILLIFACEGVLLAQNDTKLTRQGNNQYRKEKFTDAELFYRKAISANNANQKAGFNLGDALYRQNKFEDAAKQFENYAGSTGEIEKKADSFYNQGNSFVKAEKYEEAIAAYKNSLRLVPGKTEAKYNLAYAQDRLREKQDQQKNKNENKEPSEYAKKLKAQADKLVDQGLFVEAYNLMQEGLKKDETVSYYNDFITKTGKVAQIEVSIK